MDIAVCNNWMPAGLFGWSGSVNLLDRHTSDFDKYREF